MKNRILKQRLVTLKRLWGYIDGADETRSSTLDIISRTLGFRDWE